VPTDDALLVIDANLSKRLATELQRPGRTASSVSSLKLRHLVDPELLAVLAERYRDQRWVLVTGDDLMPGEHHQHIEAWSITVATVDGRWRGQGLSQEEWKREVVHRWAHVMAAQRPGTVQRYSLRSHRAWRRRRSR
jgi:hypothetical protein